MISALAFTFLQASLSAIGSLIAGAIVASWLSRKTGRFGHLIETGLTLCFFLPPLSAVIGIAVVYGTQGMGLDVYGLTGIVLAHWLLNIPVATYLFLQGFRRVPDAQVKLAIQFDRVWKLIDLDVLRRIAPLVLGITFLYAMLSFTIVLTLGGGPNTTTIELAIYHAVRIEYDLGKALGLASLQAMIGIGIFILLRKHFQSDTPALPRQIVLPNFRMRSVKVAVSASSYVICVAIAAPIMLVLLQGVRNFGSIADINIFDLLRHSVGLAILTLLFTQFLCALLFRYNFTSMAWGIGAMSPLAIAVGLILLLRAFVNPFQFGVLCVAFIQSIAMLPLASNLWKIGLNGVSKEERRLMMQLMPRKRDRVSKFWIPTMSSTAIETSAIIVALSIGDIGLLPLFAPAGYENLATKVLQSMSNYRFEAATGLNLMILIIIALVLFAGRIWSIRLETKYAAA